MALVKSSRIATRSPETPSDLTASKSTPRAKISLPNEKVGTPTAGVLFERVAAATEEFASGLTQASAAAEQLRKSMEQIAAGAEEAAGASQEQLAGAKARYTIAFEQRVVKQTLCAGARRVCKSCSATQRERITGSARAIERNAQRQGATVQIIDRTGASGGGY